MGMRSTLVNSLFDDPALAWMKSDDIRPYVFVRPENRVHHPGRLHGGLDWFPHRRVYKNPLEMAQVEFANRILSLEARAFGPSGMAMPRWVFYDCAIVPGFVAGFAARVSSLSPAVRAALFPEPELTAPGAAHAPSLAADEEWAPLSLFIIIPTMSASGEWVAHNLCSVNSLLPKTERYHGIGFLSKAFGLWYANVRTCCGMTQWTSPAVRLHAHYGDFEVLTAFTPVHSYARTLTYRVEVDPGVWPQFFRKREGREFGHIYEPAGFNVDPKDEASLIGFQERLERREGPFYLDGQETLARALDDPLTIHRKR
jgi:hypothetical protein